MWERVAFHAHGWWVTVLNPFQGVQMPLHAWQGLLILDLTTKNLEIIEKYKMQENADFARYILFRPLQTTTKLAKRARVFLLEVDGQKWDGNALRRNGGTVIPSGF